MEHRPQNCKESRKKAKKGLTILRPDDILTGRLRAGQEPGKKGKRERPNLENDTGKNKEEEDSQFEQMSFEETGRKGLVERAGEGVFTAR